MTANSFPDKALRGMQARELLPESRQEQEIDTADVVAVSVTENIRKDGNDFNQVAANSNLHKNMRPRALKEANSIPSNILFCSRLRGIEYLKGVEESGEKHNCLIAHSTLVRWCKFNLVGALGIVVQFAALFFLRSMMHFNYLFATVIAVEAAVVHNFVWHEQFTWADRTRFDSAQPSGSRSWLRLLRFNLTNGAVSILGNLALMKVMVGLGHMNYLLANGIAIALCSVANFLVSEEWVFARE